MIVRIATEGQYDLDDGEADRLNELDNAVVAAVEAGNEDNFHQLYGQMIELVRDRGRPVPDEELVESEVGSGPAPQALESGEEQGSQEQAR